MRSEIDGAGKRTAAEEPLLKIKGLKTHFHMKEGIVKAVDSVDLVVSKHEVFGLVGESGCGKSVSMLSVLRLIDPPGRIVSGEVHFNGTSILDLSEQEMREMRGSKISMVFQDPISSLNPVFNLGEQIAEVFRIHQDLDHQKAQDRAIELLDLVGLPDPGKRASYYPHQISGGQAQRVMIAMALALDPELLIADEPTTALDVTIQAQILDLLRDLGTSKGTSIILITHDLGVVGHMCNRVGVMYAGEFVEMVTTSELFYRPLHPYTQGLIASMPVLGEVSDRLDTIPGTVPDLIEMPTGCRFADRCQARLEYDCEICTEEKPRLNEVRQGHWARCWLYESYEGRKPLIEA